MHFETVQRAVSAACLPDRTVLSLRPSPDSTLPIEFINYETEYGPDGTGELLCHVRGDWEDFDTAAVALTNAGRRNLQVLAVAANAAILPPHLQVAYEPRPAGSFVALRSLGSDPQAARRQLDVDRAFALLGALEQHPKEERLLRAIENYGESLRRSHPVSSIHAVLHLWMAVESLTVVVAHRAMTEQGLKTVQELGLVLGVPPRPGSDEPDVRDVHGALRRKDIFQGDEDTHRALRAASDGIEHGYLSFGQARERVERIFDGAAAYIRRSILMESGLLTDDIEALTSGVYTRPLPLWRPNVVAQGAFADDSTFDFSRPVHIRVDADLRIEEIEPDQHATAVAIEPTVRTFNGLGHSLQGLALEAPGQVSVPTRHSRSTETESD